MRDHAAPEKRVVDGDIARDRIGRRVVDFAVGDTVTRRQTHRAVGVDLGRQRVFVTDLARHQHRHCVILGNRDHIDAVLVDIVLLVRGTGGDAGVGDRVGIFGAD